MIEKNQDSRPALVLDRDTAYLAGIQAATRPIVIHDILSAQREIEATEVPLSTIFINWSDFGTEALTVLQTAFRFRPMTPVFLMYRDKDQSVQSLDISRMGVAGILPRTDKFEDLMQRHTPLYVEEMDFDLVSDAVLGTLHEHSKEYRPIGIDQFLSGMNVPFNVHLRLGPNHFVRFLAKGDRFSTDQIKSLITRQVFVLYFKFEELQPYLDYCDELAFKVLNSPKASSEVKVERTQQFGHETLNFLREQGVSEKGLQYAQRYVESVEKLARSTQLDQNPVIKKLMADLVHYDHAVSATIMASFMCQSMGIDESKAIEVVGLGCLLHDIGLYELPNELHEEDESKLTPDQKKLYRTHPQLGAEILRSIQGVEQSVIDLVRQHHERRNLKGFPQHAGVHKVNPLAEIVGISEEFTRLVQASAKDPSIDVFSEMEKNFYPGFSKNIVDRFKEFFFNSIL